MELHTGHHLITQFLGMNVNMDTIYMTWLTAVIVIGITVLATRGRSLVPSGVQNVVEIVIEALLK
ncbi:MAG: F0F1 ATP synthase subunit A, partial [Megasphaera sp.]|nr:F0F1 ATP synthase subunit A [Megasphaera sp.]